VPKLIIQCGDKEWTHEMEESITYIGRAPENNVRLPDRHVSAKHCRIERTNEGYIIFDLGGLNGTIVNGKQINEKRLRPGDRIEIGKSVIYFQRAPDHSDSILRVIEGKDEGRTFDLSGKLTTLGRHSSCDIRLKDASVSNFHAVLEIVGHMLIVRDLNSTNGTFVNGVRVKDFKRIEPGDRVKVGDTVLEVESRVVEERAPTPAEELTLETVPAGRTTKGDTTIVEEEARRLLLERTRTSAGAGWVIVPIAIVVVVIGILASKGYLKLGGLLPEGGEGAKKIVDLLEGAGHFKAVEGAVLPENWQPEGGEWSLDKESVRPGSEFHSLSVQADRDGISTMVCAKRIPVEEGRSYLLDGWLMSEGAMGISTYGIFWWDENNPALFWESFAPPVFGKKDWHNVRYEFEPPVGATHLQVVCLAMGNSGRVYFGDVELKSRESSRMPVSFEGMGENTLLVTMNDAGLLSVRRGGRLLAWNGQFFIQPEEGGLRLRQALAQRSESGEARIGLRKEVAGKLINPATYDIFFFKEDLISAETEIRVDYQISTEKEMEVASLGLQFMVAAEDISQGVMLCFEIENEVRQGEFTASDVREVIIGSGSRQMVLDFPAAFSVECKPQGERALLTVRVDDAPLVPDEVSVFEVIFKATSERMREQARTALAMAASSATADEIGVALRGFESVASNPFFPEPERKRAREELEKIKREADKLIADAAKKCDAAIASGDEADYKEFEALLIEIEQKLSGTDYVSKVGELRTRIQEARQEKIAKAERDLKKLLAKALEFYEKEAWLPAEIFCKNVIKRAPGSDEAKEAKALMERIKRAKEAAEERNKWIEARIRAARMYYKNHFYQKAIEILEDVIQRYPNSPKIEEVKKLLEDARKASSKK